MNLATVEFKISDFAEFFGFLLKNLRKESCFSIFSVDLIQF